MAVFRSLQTLISRSRRQSRTFFTLSLSSPGAATTSQPPRTLSNNHRHFLFWSKFISPLSYNVGPLFLSSPPWKLSQSATPLLLQSDAVLNFLKLRAAALDLLHQPYNLRFGTRLLTQGELRKETDHRNVSEVEAKVEFGGKVADSYLNFPNYISFARLLSGPLLGWMITHEMYTSAFVGLAISGVSDWLDGYAARKMGINSVVGSYLDPLADKVLIGCVALAMVDRGLLHPGLVALVVVRDVALVGGAVYKRASSLNWKWQNWSDFLNLDGVGSQKVEPLLISKVNTVFQLLLVAAALLQPGFGNEETQQYIVYLSWLVASTTVASTAAYGAEYLKHGSALLKKPTIRS